MQWIGLMWSSSLAFAGAVALTGVALRYAVQRRVLDIPNARSSHARPTPRGGGVSIVLVALAGFAVLWDRGDIAHELFWAVAIGGLAVASAGLLDDFGNVGVRPRLTVHFLAAAWGVWWLGPVTAADLGLFAWDWAVPGNIVAVLGLVWLLNLYNFMDGIDGIAGAEALFVAGAGALFLWLGDATGLAGAAVLLGGAVAGFLIWNWPPAKIFLGDVGSGFIGLVLGLLGLAGVLAGAVSHWTWLILLGVFVVDATTTLLRRCLRGEAWYRAHCAHAYQHAARRWDSHAKVTTGVIAIDLVWLFPWAWVSWQWPDFGWLAAALALAPLLGLALWLGAGIERGRI